MLENKKTEAYVKLNEDDFKTLVSGGQVKKTDINGNKVYLILADISFKSMLKHIIEN